MLKRLSLLLILVFAASQQTPAPVRGDILQWSCSTTAWVDGGPYTVRAAGPWKGRRAGDMDHDPVVVDLSW